MTEPSYCTREQVARATDVKATADADAAIDRLIFANSRSVDRRYHRRFYPLIEARTYDLASGGSGDVGIWLEADLISVSELTVDGTAVDPGDITPTPADLGPPYSGVDFVSPGGSELVITGAWGYGDDEAPAGALAEALDASETDVTVSNAALVGVGDLIHVENERMVVTGRSLVTTTATLAGDVAAQVATATIPVSDGTLVHTGEVITVDAERMLVIDVAGDDLIVRRAVDGSTLAAHNSSAVVYAHRVLTVERGAAGTTAASHADATAVTRNVPPGPITELVIAETIAALQQQLAGWARTAGTGAATAGVAPEGLEQLRDQADAFRRWRIGRVI